MEPALALLDRYVAGDCTPDETARVRRWLDAHPEAQLQLTQVSEIRAVAAAERTWDVHSGWQDMTRQMAAMDSDHALLVNSALPETVATHVSVPSHTVTVNGGQSNKRRPYGYFLGGICGAVAAGVILFSLGYRKAPFASILPTAQRVSTYTTGAGQRSTVTLPDGSRIFLNVGSRLEVPVDFAQSNRIVKLSGEAVFTVRHHSGAPFTVVTNTSTTRVLGTSFLVRQYSTDSAATIAVRDGKVKVQSAVLTARQQVRVRRNGIEPVTVADTTQFTFTTGVLSLPDMPLTAAIPRLNRWYDATIILGDSRLARRRIAGGFTAGSITDLATILELTYNVRVVRRGHTLTLYPAQ